MVNQFLIHLKLVKQDDKRHILEDKMAQWVVGQLEAPTLRFDSQHERRNKPAQKSG